MNRCRFGLSWGIAGLILAGALAPLGCNDEKPPQATVAVPTPAPTQAPTPARPPVNPDGQAVKNIKKLNGSRP